jgi:hypothetical protein
LMRGVRRPSDNPAARQGKTGPSPIARWGTLTGAACRQAVYGFFHEGVPKLASALSIVE